MCKTSAVSCIFEDVAKANRRMGKALSQGQGMSSSDACV